MIQWGEIQQLITFSWVSSLQVYTEIRCNLNSSFTTKGMLIGLILNSSMFYRNSRLPALNIKLIEICNNVSEIKNFIEVPSKDLTWRYRRDTRELIHQGSGGYNDFLSKGETI